MSFSTIGRQMSFNMLLAALALFDIITQNFLLPVASKYNTAISAADVFPYPLGSSMLYGRDYDKANSISFNASINFSDGLSSIISPTQYVSIKSMNDADALSRRSQSIISRALSSCTSIDEAASSNFRLFLRFYYLRVCVILMLSMNLPWPKSFRAFRDKYIFNTIREPMLSTI